MHCVLFGLLFGSHDKHDTTNSDKLFGHGAVKMVVISIGGTYNQSHRQCGFTFGNLNESASASFNPAFHGPPPILTLLPVRSSVTHHSDGVPITSHTLHN